MQRFLRILILLVAPSAAFAQSGEPLVTVRFNQPRVYYDQQLYNALTKAVAIKPDLLIEVVSLAPQTGNAKVDAAWQQAASAHTQQVVASLQQIGVPASRITVRGQAAPGLRADEAQVFVR